MAVRVAADAAKIALDARTASTVAWSFAYPQFFDCIARAGWLVTEDERYVGGMTASGVPFSAVYATFGGQCDITSLGYVAAAPVSLAPDRPDAAEDHAVITKFFEAAVDAVTEGVGQPGSRSPRQTTWSLSGADLALELYELPSSIFGFTLRPT